MTRPLAATLGLALACTGTAQAFDTYQPDGRLLSIPTLQVGTLTFTDVVVTVGSIVTPPGGDSAIGNIDTYSPLNGQLTVPTVIALGNTYYNVVATVAGLSSAAGVTGADTYDAASGQLTLPQVSFDGAIYTNVVVTVGGVVSGGGGLPRNTLDTYDAANRQLTIAAVQAGSAVFTNPVITPGRIISIGGQLPAESPLYRFNGFAAAGGGDGAAPQAGLIVGSDGNLYGTTIGGGTGNGTVFRLTPTGGGSVVYAFGAAGAGDAAQPFGGLVQDGAGNLYGTTLAGGAHAAGAIYRISPGGTESLVYSFGADESDGTVPYGGLVLDGAGNLWGTTSQGGAQGFGTVFTVSPSGTETVVYSFTGGTADGANPYAGLAAANGSFYGTTTAAGANGGGTVFQITPTSGTGAAPSATFTPLYSFGNGSDVAVPYAPLLLGNDGNFYGTGYEGGQYGAGGVFVITPAGTETLLYSFSGGGNVVGSADGASPYGGLIEDSRGNFYGTTVYGGAYDEGTVYRITVGPAGTDSSELLLYSFSGAGSGNGGLGGSLDGANPYGPLVLAADGSIYGTTFGGGTDGGGVVFALTKMLTAH
jgi:uncharacterized repeat protein (TIGR03803 family)